jgi:hypothetical protein
MDQDRSQSLASERDESVSNASEPGVETKPVTFIPLQSTTTVWKRLTATLNRINRQVRPVRVTLSVIATIVAIVGGVIGIAPKACIEIHDMFVRQTKKEPTPAPQPSTQIGQGERSDPLGPAKPQKSSLQSVASFLGYWTSSDQEDERRGYLYIQSDGDGLVVQQGLLDLSADPCDPGPYAPRPTHVRASDIDFDSASNTLRIGKTRKLELSGANSLIEDEGGDAFTIRITYSRTELKCR